MLKAQKYVFSAGIFFKFIDFKFLNKIICQYVILMCVLSF